MDSKQMIAHTPVEVYHPLKQRFWKRILIVLYQIPQVFSLFRMLDVCKSKQFHRLEIPLQKVCTNYKYER